MRGKSDKERRLRLHGAVARSLGTAIVSGRHKPGAILDNEIEASSQLAVSRTVYREAVRMLAAKGLVESRPKVGTRVSPVHQWHLLDPDVLSWMFSADPDPSVLRSLFELRMIVEPAAAALAASRRTDKHVETMRRAVADMQKHTLREKAGRDADLDFHAALLEASDNAFIVSLTNGVTAAVDALNDYKNNRRALRRDPTPDHARVCDAIAARDPVAARQAMDDLLRMAIADTPMQETRPRKKPARSRRS